MSTEEIIRGGTMDTEEIITSDKAVQEVQEAIKAAVDMVADIVPKSINNDDRTVWPLILQVAEMIQRQKNFNTQEQAWLQSSADTADWQAAQMVEIRKLVK